MGFGLRGYLDDSLLAKGCTVAGYFTVEVKEITKQNLVDKRPNTNHSATVRLVSMDDFKGSVAMAYQFSGAAQSASGPAYIYLDEGETRDETVVVVATGGFTLIATGTTSEHMDSHEKDHP